MKWCPKHPKYRGKKKPKSNCVDCLSIYSNLMMRPRSEFRPTKVIRDKTKYTRKKKHKYDE